MYTARPGANQSVDRALNKRPQDRISPLSLSAGDTLIALLLDRDALCKIPRLVDVGTL